MSTRLGLSPLGRERVRRQWGWARARSAKVHMQIITLDKSSVYVVYSSLRRDRTIVVDERAMQLGQTQITRTRKDRACNYKPCEDKIKTGSLHITVWHKTKPKWRNRHMHPECWPKWAVYQLVAHWEARKAAGRPSGSRFDPETKRKRLALQKRRVRIMWKIQECTNKEVLLPLIEEFNNIQKLMEATGGTSLLNGRTKLDKETIVWRIRSKSLV